MTRRELLLLGVGAAGVLAGCASIPPRAGAPAKRLIESGRDEPDTAFMRRHIARMEQAPFDGVVFHVADTRPDGTPGNCLWEAWGRRALTDTDLAPGLAELTATAFRRFAHNFLRFNTTPGDPDWFDGFSAILANARLAAGIARAGGAAGSEPGRGVEASPHGKAESSREDELGASGPPAELSMNLSPPRRVADRLTACVIRSW